MSPNVFFGQKSFLGVIASSVFPSYLIPPPFLPPPCCFPVSCSHITSVFAYLSLCAVSSILFSGVLHPHILLLNLSPLCPSEGNLSSIAYSCIIKQKNCSKILYAETTNSLSTRRLVSCPSLAPIMLQQSFQLSPDSGGAVSIDDLGEGTSESRPTSEMTKITHTQPAHYRRVFLIYKKVNKHDRSNKNSKYYHNIIRTAEPNDFNR